MSQQPSHPGDEQDEASLVARALEDMKRNAYLTKRGFDQNNVVAALAFASQMIHHLRTSKLGPTAYYELWMSVTEALRDCEYQFDELDAQDRRGEGGKSVMELYETVQHCGNVVPRLYLLITVGSSYIKSRRAPAKDILFDLVELCRDVQHPMRGLFLRSYLSHMAKGKLPDTGSEYEGSGGTVADAIEFILQNFSEMNKLWVRMQHQGAVRDRARREKERRSLRQLVSTNLDRLSHLNGLTLQLYKDEVLPRVLEQIVNCKDVIAQEYLMDCVIKVFPDEFHLDTLDLFLASCAQLQEKVNVKDILVALMTRLSTYAKTVIAAGGSPDGLASGAGSTSSAGAGSADAGAGAGGKTGAEAFHHMFPLFAEHSARIIKAQPKMPLADVLALQVALLNFCSVVFPARTDFVDQILAFSASVLKGPAAAADAPPSAANMDSKCVRHVVDLLTIPLQGLGLTFLQLVHYEPLLHCLALEQRKQVTSAICTALLERRTPLADVGTAHALFTVLSPLLKDEAGAEAGAEADAEVDKFELEQEQHLVARLFHLIHSDDIDTQFKIYLDVRKSFGQGGPARLEHTLPPLVYGAMQLAERAHSRESGRAAAAVAAAADTAEGGASAAVVPEGKIKAKRIFSFIHETIMVLFGQYPEIALRLFVQTAFVADKCRYEEIAYEFMAQAFLCYETEIADSKAQLAAINYIVGALVNFSSFSKENHETLVSKATQHSSKLLAKPDQCRAVYNCAHMFWPADPNHPGRDDKRVLLCLQRSIKVANSCMGNHTHLFVEILNKYIYFFQRGCPSIEVKHIKGLIALIEEHMGDGTQAQAGGSQAQIAGAHYRNTMVLLETHHFLGSEETPAGPE